jgi:hypothetical protein
MWVMSGHETMLPYHAIKRKVSELSQDQKWFKMLISISAFEALILNNPHNVPSVAFTIKERMDHL